MHLLSKVAVLAAGIVAAVSAATLAQPPAARSSSTSSETLVIDGRIDWLVKSDVSALREGVIDKMEVEVGMPVKANGTIGTLHSEMAQLNFEKAEIAARNESGVEKAHAQKELALTIAARLDNLRRRNVTYVSQDELSKAAAEVKVAQAMLNEAKEARKQAEAERKIAKQIVDEHTIRAPFDGVVYSRIRHPGESVAAKEPVISLGQIDKLKFYGFIYVDSAFRVKEGMTVDFKPVIEGVDVPIEQKRFRGKITFIAPELQGVGKSQREVFAELVNNTGYELLPNLKGELTVYLNSLNDPASAGPAPADMLRDKGGDAAPPVLGARTPSR